MPDEDQVGIIRWAADQVINGKSLTALCADLTRRGVETSRGKTIWRDTSLGKILRSPILLGRVPRNGGLARDDAGLVVQREPILTDETWARLQAALAKASKPRAGSRSSAMIGVLFCKVCSGPMYIQRRTNRPTSYYRCRTATREKTCASRMVPVGPVESLISESLLQACGDVRMAYEILESTEDQTAELAAVEEALSHMEDQLVGGQVSPEAWGRAVARLEKRQAELRTELEALPEPAVQWVETGKTFGQAWADLDEDGRRALLVANDVRVRAQRQAAPGAEDFSVPVRFFSDLARTEDRSDILIVSRGDLEATIHLGNLDRLRKRLALYQPG